MDSYAELCTKLGVGVRGVNEMTNDAIAEEMCRIFDAHISDLKSRIFQMANKGCDE